MPWRFHWERRRECPTSQERRLCAALRHEQQTVAMVLSAARHHSGWPAPAPVVLLLSRLDSSLAILQAQAEEKRRKEEEVQLAKEKEEAKGDVSASCSAVPAAGADALPPRHLGTVFRVHVAGGVIKGDDGRMFPFRSSCMKLAVGYRVSFFVRGLAAYGLTRVS